MLFSALMVNTEEFSRGEGAHHQTAQGGTATSRGQTGAAEETTTEPDPEGEHCAEGKKSPKSVNDVFMYVPSSMNKQKVKWTINTVNTFLGNWFCSHSPSFGKRKHHIKQRTPPGIYYNLFKPPAQVSIH